MGATAELHVNLESNNDEKSKLLQLLQHNQSVRREIENERRLLDDNKVHLVRERKQLEHERENFTKEQECRAADLKRLKTLDIDVENVRMATLRLQTAQQTIADREHALRNEQESLVLERNEQERLAKLLKHQREEIAIEEESIVAKQEARKEAERRLGHDLALFQASQTKLATETQEHTLILQKANRATEERQRQSVCLQQSLAEQKAKFAKQRVEWDVARNEQQKIIQQRLDVANSKFLEAATLSDALDAKTAELEKLLAYAKLAFLQAKDCIQQKKDIDPLAQLQWIKPVLPILSIH